MWIDTVPDGLAAHCKLGQAVPVVAGTIDHRLRCRVQADLVLACATMPDTDGTLAAVDEIIPERELMRARSPSCVRQADGAEIFHVPSPPTSLPSSNTLRMMMFSSPLISLVVACSGLPQPRSINIAIARSLISGSVAGCVT